METDFSRILYDRYLTLDNRNIEITLKSGEKVKGVIAGFFRNEECEQPYITRWRVVTGSKQFTWNFDAFGTLQGTIVNNADIAQVKFLQDNSVMDFSQ
ncbi:MAG: hypothetical protein KIS94_07220 [Chitinophagales bacterium]|nr:hypothetical protein [Chitinophagales bacterium]